MEKLIKRRYIESFEDDEVLILKIFEKKGKLGGGSPLLSL